MPNPTTDASWQRLLQMPPKSFWARLPFSVRMSLSALGVLLILGTGVAAFRTVVADQPPAAQSAGGHTPSSPATDVAQISNGEPRARPTGGHGPRRGAGMSGRSGRGLRP